MLVDLSRSSWSVTGVIGMYGALVKCIKFKWNISSVRPLTWLYFLVLGLIRHRKKT